MAGSCVEVGGVSGDSWKSLCAVVQSLAVTLEGLRRRDPCVGVLGASSGSSVEVEVEAEVDMVWRKETVPEIPRQRARASAKAGQQGAEGGGEFRRC